MSKKSDCLDAMAKCGAAVQECHRKIISDLLKAMGYEDAVIFDSPDYADAFIGVTHDGRVVYDYALMVQHLIKQGMTEEEAIEFIDYNTLGSLGFDGCPVVVNQMR